MKAGDVNAGESSPESPPPDVVASASSPTSAPTSPPASGFEDIRLSSRTTLKSVEEATLAPPNDTQQPARPLTPTPAGSDINRSRSPARFGLNASAGEKCFACDKLVYPAERCEITANGQQRVYHKATCLRCSKCNCLLSYAASVPVFHSYCCELPLVSCFCVLKRGERTTRHRISTFLQEAANSCRGLIF